MNALVQWRPRQRSTDRLAEAGGARGERPSANLTEEQEAIYYRVASVLRPVVLMARSQGQRMTLSVPTATYATGRSQVMGQVVNEVIEQISPADNPEALDIKAVTVNGFVIVTIYRRAPLAGPPTEIGSGDTSPVGRPVAGLPISGTAAVVGSAAFQITPHGGADLESGGRQVADEGGWMVAGPRPDGGYTVTLAFPAADPVSAAQRGQQVFFATGRLTPHPPAAVAGHGTPPAAGAGQRTAP